MSGKASVMSNFITSVDIDTYYDALLAIATIAPAVMYVPNVAVSGADDVRNSKPSAKVRRSGDRSILSALLTCEAIGKYNYSAFTIAAYAAYTALIRFSIDARRLTRRTGGSP